MLNRVARAGANRLLTPVAKALLRLGAGPDIVTMVGTLGVSIGALAFYSRGQLLVGTLVITAFVFSDTVDGIMARLAGRTSAWGAFLDSVLDRVGDASIFLGLAIWFVGAGDNDRVGVLALACLILGGVVSYSKARAESLGYTADVGLAERADRLVAVLVATGLVGLFDLPIVVLEVVLWLVAAASAWTILQRVWTVRQQSWATR